MFFELCAAYVHQEASEKELKKAETNSYEHVKLLLDLIGENSCVIGNGQCLPNGLLFNVAVHTMRKNIIVRSVDLRKTGEEPKHVFNLCGRSDVIALLPGRLIVSRMNTRYVIEVKVKGFKLNEALKESYLQLVGLSIDNNNTSPPVILTDLNEKHYVLCLEVEDSLSLKFRLSIKQFPSLLLCIQRCRALANLPCITTRFGSAPTPPSSLQSDAGGNNYGSDEEAESVFGKCIIDEH